MPEITFPFDKQAPKCNHNSAGGCIVLNSLPPEMREITRKHPHLLSYLHLVPLAEIGVPRYYEKLSRDMAEISNPNIIYPVLDNMFIHILDDPNDARTTYISIEPVLNQNMDSVMQEFEKKLLDISDLLVELDSEDLDAKKAAFLQLVDHVCTTNGHKQDGASSNMGAGKSGLAKSVLNSVKKRFGNGTEKLVVTPQQLRNLKYILIRDKLGLGVLEPMIQDLYIEDISCSGQGVVYLEHKIYRSVKSILSFSTHDELDTFVMRLSERIKKPVSVHSPICDATLPDGSRINIVYGRDISKRGSNFTIRRFSETPLSILDLVDLGTLDFNMAGYLAVMIGEGMNVFVCGETASGKTTSLNAVTTFINPNAKIVSIEDTPELQVPHKNWIREVVSTTKEGEETGVTMFDLLKAALRQRPNEIIIGEIRGAEGAIAFQAMQTGHSVMTTFHAASVERLIQRLTGSPINVPKTYLDNLNIIIIQSAVKLATGKRSRRITGIYEIVGYDSDKSSVSFVEAFRWDPVMDTFIFAGRGNSYLMEYKIAPLLGLHSSEKKKLYAEIDRRSRVLEKIHKQGIRDFNELLKILGKAQKEGLF